MDPTAEDLAVAAVSATITALRDIELHVTDEHVLRLIDRRVQLLLQNKRHLEELRKMRSENKKPPRR